MPKQYEAIRDRFIAKGMPAKEAKTRAAKIFQSLHPGKGAFIGGEWHYKRKK